MSDVQSRVQISTFNKYYFRNDFQILDSDETEGVVKSLRCKVCSSHIVSIREEARRRGVKGSALKGVLSYAESVTYIHKANLTRHVKSGGLHDWAKKTFSATSSKTDTSQTGSAARLPSGIDKLLSQSNRVCYEHLFRTVLYIAMSERPFRDFEGLVTLQKKNGVSFINGNDSDKRCRYFLTYIAKAMQSDLKTILERANFVSGMMDGSQARKTGTEKELVYAKVVINGSPVELLLDCQNMADFGGEDAKAVKKAFDSAFLDKMDERRFKQLLISVCCDGASVNMGQYNGATTKLKEERDWLLVIHCSNHRLELAVQDAFKSDGSFLEVDELMTHIYYMFRNSGKAKRLLSSVALALNVTCVSFVKASGTRFQNHKYAAVKAMIINFLPLCLYLENMIGNRNACRAETSAKLKGYLNKLKCYRYLASLHFYHQVLRVTAHLAFLMQRQSTMVTDVIYAIREAKSQLAEIAESQVDLPFEATETDDEVTITASSTNKPASLTFKDKHQLTEKQKEQVSKYTQSIHQQFDVKGVKEGKKVVEKIKKKLITDIADCIDKRFANFSGEREIYQAVQLADYTFWDYDDKNFGMDKISTLAGYFKDPLSHHGFSVDRAFYEFRHLKTLVSEKFCTFKNKVMCWRAIFTHHAHKFPHILLLIELCLVIGISSATVERGFSTAGRILSDSRLSMKKETMNDLLQVRINLPVMKQLDPSYEEILIGKAIDLYFADCERRRYESRPKSSTEPSVVKSAGDMFVPTPFSHISSSNLQSLEEFVILDSDSDDEAIGSQWDAGDESDSEENVVDQCAVSVPDSVVDVDMLFDTSNASHCDTEPDFCTSIDQSTD